MGIYVFLWLGEKKRGKKKQIKGNKKKKKKGSQLTK